MTLITYALEVGTAAAALLLVFAEAGLAFGTAYLLFGALVHERTDPAQRGKGYALRWLFRGLLADPQAADAFVVIDADSVVNPAFLRALDRHLAAGAVAIQGYDTVLNPGASWGTALRY